MYDIINSGIQQAIVEGIRIQDSLNASPVFCFLKRKRNWLKLCRINLIFVEFEKNNPYRLKF